MEIYTRNWSQNYDHFNSITGEGNIVEGDERDKLIEAATELAYLQSGGRGGQSLLQLPDGRLILHDSDSGNTSVSMEAISLIELNQALVAWKNAPLVNDECIGYRILYYCTACRRVHPSYNLSFSARGRLYVDARESMDFAHADLNVDASTYIVQCRNHYSHEADPLLERYRIISLYCDIKKYDKFFNGRDKFLSYTVEDVEDMLAPESLAVVVQETV